MTPRPVVHDLAVTVELTVNPAEMGEMRSASMVKNTKWTKRYVRMTGQREWSRGWAPTSTWKARIATYFVGDRVL